MIRLTGGVISADVYVRRTNRPRRKTITGKRRYVYPISAAALQNNTRLMTMPPP
jgi:hypothetical protein